MSVKSLENNDSKQNDSFTNHILNHYNIGGSMSTSSSPVNSETNGQENLVSPDFNSNNNNNNNVNSLTSNEQGGANQTKMYKCKQCVFICVNKEDYWMHQRQMHIKPEKLLECSKCSFVTEYKHHLEYHLRNHMGSKPYKCSQCEYACVNLSMLRSHLKSHSKAIQYNCAECSYSTKYYNSLKAHMDKFNHTCSSSNHTMSAASIINNMSNGKIKNQVTMSQKTNSSSSSSSSTCSSSSFKSSQFNHTNQQQQQHRKSQKPNNTSNASSNKAKDGGNSVNSSNSSVSSASSSLSSSPNWSVQLNINPNNNTSNNKDQMSPTNANFNTTATLAAAALAFQQQNQQQQQQQSSVANFLMNPSLLFNQNFAQFLVPNSGANEGMSFNTDNNDQNDSDKDANNNDKNDNQFNMIQQQLQLQMALAMAASSNNNQFQTGQTNSQPFSNILSDLYLQQQQKNQQEQLLLAASYLHQQQQMSSTNGKRSLEDVTAEVDNSQAPFPNVNTAKKRKDAKKLKLHQQPQQQHNEILSSENSEIEQQKHSPNSQLHECYKCELIFRNYEMFCAHKMLHEIQGQSAEDESNINTSAVNGSNDPNNVQSSNLNTNNSQDLNRLIAENIQQNINKQQQQPESQLTDNSIEYLECNQCNLKMSNALEFFIHVQSFHANGINTQSTDSSELKQES